MEDLYYAVKLEWQKLCKSYAKFTPTTGMLLISAQIVYPAQKLWSFRQSEKGIVICPDNETSYATQ